MVYIMYMYVNKRVKLAQREIAHIENLCIIIFIITTFVAYWLGSERQLADWRGSKYMHT